MFFSESGHTVKRDKRCLENGTIFAFIKNTANQKLFSKTYLENKYANRGF